MGNFTGSSNRGSNAGPTTHGNAPSAQTMPNITGPWQHATTNDLQRPQCPTPGRSRQTAPSKRTTHT
eukprot:10323077-Lingulodinium_polyedra.AAC.1